MPFDSIKDIPSLEGKVILVTGGNAGVGKATVRALARHAPATLYLAARRRDAAEAAAAEVAAETGYQGIVVVDLDLASFSSVRQCAAQITAEASRLDVLFLNAGVSSTPAALTKDGYETQFGINHMGHALLTQLLLPLLLTTRAAHPDVRVVVTSSNVAFFPVLPKNGIDYASLHHASDYSPLALYAQSKLANALFAQKLAALYPALSVTAVHPGVVTSDIWDKNSTPAVIRSLIKFVIWPFAVGNDDGAKTQLWCATAPAQDVQSGAFYVPTGKLKAYKGVMADQGIIDQFWAWTTEELAKHGATGWPPA